MKKLILILSLFTCFKSFGQTPNQPTPVNQMSWYKDLAGHMWAYRGTTLGWIQIADASQLVSGSLVKANNGLTVAADSTVQLGGTIIKSTIINTQGTNFFAIGNSGAGAGGATQILPNGASLTYKNSGGTLNKIQLNGIIGDSTDNTIVITDDILGHGAVYAGDYEANFSNRSLVTKQYVDGLTSPITASNGLTKTGSNITLGGNFNTATTILGDLSTPFSMQLYNNLSAPELGTILSVSATGGQFISLDAAQGNTFVVGANNSESSAVLRYTKAGVIGRSDISIGTGGAMFRDDIFSKGFSYTDNYFTNGSADDRWIPDWGAVKGLDANNVKLTGNQLMIHGVKNFLDSLRTSSTLDVGQNIFFGTNINGPSYKITNTDRTKDITLSVDNLTAFRNAKFQDKDGVVAYLSDISELGVNVLQYGADSTGVNKSDTPFKLAIAAAVSKHVNNIYVPSGNYRLDSLLNLPANISLLGANSNYTTIRASGVYDNYLTPDPVPIGTDGLIHAFVYSAGGLVSKGKLTTTVSKGDYFVRATTLLGLKKGDVIKIVDTTAFSYSKFRSYYREGEFFQVVRYAADSIYLDHPSRANFANVNSAFIYKLNPTTQKIQDITIKGLQDKNMTTVFIDNAEGTNISRVNIYNGARSNLSVRGGYNIKIDHMKTLQDTGLIAPYPATSYGISLIASQKVSITHSILYAYQHGFTASSSTGYYGVVNRDVILDDVFSHSIKPSFPGIDFHGDAEYCTVVNSISNGIEFGGSNMRIANNTFNGGDALGSTLYHIAMVEVKQPSFDIDNNRVELNANKESVSSRLFSMSADTLSGGTLRMTNNHFSVTNTAFTNLTRLGIIETTGSIPAGLNVVFTGNTLTNNSPQSSPFIFQGGGFGFNMGNLTISGNVLNKAKIESTYIDRGLIKNNSIRNSYDSGIKLSRFSNLDFTDNSFDGFVLNPSVNPTAAERAAFSIAFSDTVRIKGNSGTAAGTNAAFAYVLNTIGSTLVEGEYQFGTLAPSKTSVTGQDYWRVPTLYLMNAAVSLPVKTASNNGLTASAINLASSEVVNALTPTKGGTNQTTYTTGDILYASAANTLSKRAIGSTNQVLTVVAGVPTWATPSSGFTNPMTTLGDIIYGASSGTPTRLAGNTLNARLFLTSTGSAGSATAPSYFDLFDGLNSWTSVNQFTFGLKVNLGAKVTFLSTTGTNGVSLLANDSGANNYDVNLQAKAGTVALLSDISAATDNILSKTANYTIVAGDFVTGKKTTLDLYVDATGGNVTITMPSAATFAGYTIYVTKTDASVNTVTINTVLGGNTLLTQYQSRHFANNSSSWFNH